MSTKEAIKLLTEHGYKRVRPGKSHFAVYHDKIAEGLMEHKEATVLMDDGTLRRYEQILVTAKGMAEIAMQMRDMPGQARDPIH